MLTVVQREDSQQQMEYLRKLPVVKRLGSLEPVEATKISRIVAYLTLDAELLETPEMLDQEFDEAKERGHSLSYLIVLTRDGQAHAWYLVVQNGAGWGKEQFNVLFPDLAPAEAFYRTIAEGPRKATGEALFSFQPPPYRNERS